MQQFIRLLLDVWREACRHIEIAASTANIAQLLEPQMPMERLLVRRIEKERAYVETVGVGPDSSAPGLLSAQTACSATQMTRLLAWCQRGKVLLQGHDRRLEKNLAVALPFAREAELLIGPLVSEQGTYGLLCLLARSPQRFSKSHIQVFQSLLEPFAAALENDRQLRELTALRRAAEADKQSLLRRLGREELAETIVGADGGLRLVMERVALVGRSAVPVLLLGETGSGKEVIARAIHTRSARAAGPFLRVNCGAIPSELLDSELFGHERGSFTGAIGTRRGWFERADGGTLFLDEIGELPPAAQVRLLRVLQESTFERVGGERSLKVDVRIIAATHRDLAAMVQSGMFREDLWYRVAVFPIVLPPLREHPEDIPALAEHFAHRAATRFGFPPQTPSSDDIALLSAYAWPGNVRELTTVIDRAVILGEGRALEIAKALGAAPDIGFASSSGNGTALVPRHLVTTPMPLNAMLKQHIEAVLVATHGRVEGPHGAARLLQINPHSLRGRMRKLGINWRQFRSMPQVQGVVRQ
jgi:transcriptional regulator with GAF, ATPase, and Fis domain